MDTKIIHEKELDVVLMMDWYDGPLSGLSIHNNELVYFRMEDIAGDEIYYTFKIFFLTFKEKIFWRIYSFLTKQLVGEFFTLKPKYLRDIHSKIEKYLFLTFLKRFNYDN